MNIHQTKTSANEFQVICEIRVVVRVSQNKTRVNDSLDCQTNSILWQTVNVFQYLLAELLLLCQTIFEDGSTRKAMRAPQGRYKVVFSKLNTLELFFLNAFLVVVQPLRKICCGTWLFDVDVKRRLAYIFDLVDK